MYHTDVLGIHRMPMFSAVMLGGGGGGGGEWAVLNILLEKCNKTSVWVGCVRMMYNLFCIDLSLFQPPTIVLGDVLCTHKVR